MKMKGTLFLLVFWVMLFFPAISWAIDLTILDIIAPEEGTPASEAQVQVAFELRQESGMPVSDVKADQCQITIDKMTPEVKKAEIKPFIEGNQGVAVLFVFPNSKNYPESVFAIKSSLTPLLQSFNRPIDMIGAIAYDSIAQQTEWSKASEPSLKHSLQKMTNSDAIEPNLFSSFPLATKMMDDVKYVSQKYIVFISDAEGALVDDKERSLDLINFLTDKLKEKHITPIVIGYSPDGMDAMPNVDLIKRIATIADGIYFQAETLFDFQRIIMKDVYDYIFQKYIYQATLDMGGGNYLDKGKYNLQFVVKTNNGEEKEAGKIDWPDLKENNIDIVIPAISTFAGLIIGFAAAFLIASKRRRKDQ